MNAIFNFVTTAFTFIQGMAEQITPLINKFLDKQPARKIFLLYSEYYDPVC